MGIHGVDRAKELVGAVLEGVAYASVEPTVDVDDWKGRDVTEMVVLTAGGRDTTVWVSGRADRVALAGPVSEVLAEAPALIPADHRAPWGRLVGATIRGVRTASTPDGKTGHGFVQAVELAFDDGFVTIAGFRPDDELSTDTFEDLVVLPGALYELPDLKQRTIVVH